MIAEGCRGEYPVGVHMLWIRCNVPWVPITPARLRFGLRGQMSQAGYDGIVTLEVNPVAVRIWWPPAVRRYLDRAMAWMSRAVGREGAGK